MAQDKTKQKAWIFYLVVIAIIIILVAVFFVFFNKKANDFQIIDVDKYLNNIDQSTLNEAQKSFYDETKETLASDPNNYEAVIDLANLYYYIEDYDTAEVILNAVLDNDPPDKVVALQNLAAVYHNQARYKDAENTYYEILSINILWMPTYESLSGLYRFELVQRTDAFPEIINQAREIDFQDQYEQPLLKTLAFFYKYKGDIEKSISLFEEYVGKFPDDEIIKKELAELKSVN